MDGEGQHVHQVAKERFSVIHQLPGAGVEQKGVPEENSGLSLAAFSSQLCSDESDLPLLHTTLTTTPRGLPNPDPKPGMSLN